MSNIYGVTQLGYNKKTFENIMDEMERDLKSKDAFGEDIDFSDEDPLKQIFAVFAKQFSDNWEDQEQSFYVASPQFAEDNNLSNVAKKIGISRNQASFSSTPVEFTGIPGTIIPIGYKPSTLDLIAFSTLSQAVIGSSGKAIVKVQADVAGKSGNVPTGTITNLLNPILGISSVTNPSAAVGGQDQESDLELRNKYEQSTSSGEGYSVDSIKANVLKVQGVESVTVTENSTDTKVGNLTPHSIFVLVKGGDNTAVAKAIFQRHSAGGATMIGDVSVTLKDTQNIDKVVKFSRPVDKNIWVKATITKEASYPIDGDIKIKNTIVNYIESLKISEDVVIYKIINSIAALNMTGLSDIKIELSTDGATFVSTNITIADAENAKTENSKVVIQ